MLFEQGISARKFATAKVDAFDESVAGSVMDAYKHDFDAKHLERMSQRSDSHNNDRLVWAAGGPGVGEE